MTPDRCLSPFLRFHERLNLVIKVKRPLDYWKLEAFESLAREVLMEAIQIMGELRVCGYYV